MRMRWRLLKWYLLGKTEGKHPSADGWQLICHMQSGDVVSSPHQPNAPKCWLFGRGFWSFNLKIQLRVWENLSWRVAVKHVFFYERPNFNNSSVPVKNCHCQCPCFINVSFWQAVSHWDFFMLSNGQYQFLAERTTFLSSRGPGLTYMQICCACRAAYEVCKDINLGKTTANRSTVCKMFFGGLSTLKCMLRSDLPAPLIRVVSCGF